MDTQVIGIAALAIVLPIVASLVKHFTKKPDFTEKDREMLIDLFKMHSVTDSDGRPIWYNSINQHAHNLRTTELMRDIIYTQKQVVGLLEKLADKMDKRENGKP